MTKFMEIKFIYGLTFWPTKRSRKLRVTEVESSIRVPILELEEAEFPKAFEFPTKARICLWKGLKTVTIRSYQGQLYSVVERNKDVSSVDSIVRYYNYNNYFPFPRLIDYEYGHFKEGVSIVEKNYKNEMIARVLKEYGDYYKHYVIFEGKLWETVDEPRYNVYLPHGFDDYFNITVETNYSNSSDIIAPFNANQLKLAIQYAKKKVKEISDREHLNSEDISCFDSIIERAKEYEITVYNQNFVTAFVPEIIIQFADEVKFGSAIFRKAQLKMGEYNLREPFEEFTEAYKASLFIQNGELTPLGEILFEERGWQLVKRDGLYIAEVKCDYFD